MSDHVYDYEYKVPFGPLKPVEPQSSPKLIVHGWYTECSGCGYGKGGWAGGPGRKGLPILTPDSKVCHGCEQVFDGVESDNPNVTIYPRPADEPR